MDERNIMILAIGNAGGNIIDTIRREAKSSELKAAKYVYADCDERDLHRHNADTSQSTLLKNENEAFPAEIFKGVENLVIVAGLGGNTAAEFTELAAAAAKDSAVKSLIVVATMPFHFERENRISSATLAVQRLSELEDVKTVVFNNDDLMSKYPNLNFFNAFETADKEIMHIIENLT
ncbi:MAG: hypothetical protein HDS02_08885 [Bacteroides sp.]|nr:hypothetical protein [Bacteroides sp.]